MGIQHRRLYIIGLLLSAAVVLVALGGGIFHQVAPFRGQWQHQAMRNLCHQLPNRSFWVNGQPMAVCARCFGIYTSLLFFWLISPLIGYVKSNGSTNGWLLLVLAASLNLIDVAGDFMGFWPNTLYSRYLLGLLLAASVVYLLSDYFIMDSSLTKTSNYGIISTKS